MKAETRTAQVFNLNTKMFFSNNAILSIHESQNSSPGKLLLHTHFTFDLRQDKETSCHYLTITIIWCLAKKKKRISDKIVSQAKSKDCNSIPVFSHNDLPWQLLKQYNNELSRVDLDTLNTTHTNIPKIKEGRLGAQVGRGRR